ncbi:DUF4373 domain-containing protein [Muricomes sp. OA1]|uniref:DUF4373 domain-containing protein n=1 Tax=Muricomes sp. OA1 TaxID=2914165 RepID=UPI001F06E9DB|nr:DUF4373 domain-containing protein [Muricomes sp. OA1]MBS6765603.1 DUF4373 domain-containing protein [Clostridium sp.]MCH1973482.1 DUF4373 domain-containing protein [Muricomes sp. OA1]MDU7706077.1 DUF4373 domain-containing protein [Clostridium sp.]
MAGRPKKRIDYAGWSVDIFSNDTKIDKLLDAQGWVGFGIYFYLCQMAFGSEGYYYEWCYDLCATTARKMGGGVGAGTVKETVDYCLQIGLFDKRLFDGWGVLTSRGIQKSFLLVLKSKNRKGTEIYSELWLLDKNGKDYQDVVFVRKNKQKLEVNDDSLGENDNTLEVNDDSLGQKDSKVKDSKVNTVSKDTVHRTDVRRCVDAWNDLKSFGIKPVSKLTSGTKRYDSLIARIKQYGIDDVLKAIDKIKYSSFLQGRSSNRRQWTITFDWFVLPNNFPKVLDGNYDDANIVDPILKNTNIGGGRQGC